MSDLAGTPYPVVARLVRTTYSRTRRESCPGLSLTFPHNCL